QASRVVFFEINGAGYAVVGEYCADAPQISGCHSIDAFAGAPNAASGTDACRFWRNKTAVWDADTATNPELSAAEQTAFRALQVGAYITVPLHKNDAVIGGMAVHANVARAWSDAEITLACEVATRTWAAIEQAQAWRKLNRSGAKYQALFESMDEAYCILEVLFDETDQPCDFRIVEANAAFSRHSGLPNATGKMAREVMPELECKWIAVFGRIARSGEAQRFEEHSTALERWLDIYAFRVGEPGANLVAVLFSDISERKQAEAERARLAAIVDSSDDAIISKDLDGMIQSWNAGAERLFGYTAAEMIGQTINRLMPPGHMQEEADILRRISRGERIAHFETLRRRKNDTDVDVSLSISPLVDKSGRIVGASKIARNISERRRADLLQEHQIRLLELIASGAPLEQCLDALCRAVPQISRGARASIVVADAPGAALPQPIAPQLQASWREGLTDILLDDLMHGTRGKTIYRGEPVVCADIAADERWPREWRELCAANGVRAAYAVPVRGEDKQPIGSFMLCFEHARKPTAWQRQLADFGSYITSIALEHTRINEALRAANRHKDEFLAALAHELRNPLAPLRNALEVMDRDGPETTAQARALMARQLAQLTHLVNELLDISRVTRGKIELHLAPTDLEAVVQDAVAATRDQLAATRHALHVALPEQPITLVADFERLAQVLVNLINNAAKYTAAGGRIDIVLQQEESAAVLAVRDTGMGITAEQLPHIFDMFIQSEQPAEKASEGLGVGLTLVKQVVELHGGTIEAHSKGRDQGSEFIMRLPLTAAESTPESESAAALSEKISEEVAEEQAGAASPRRLRLLLVEDNYDVADAMALLLGSMDHDVRIAYDGYQALEEAAEYQPDAVFLDLGLPGIDGVETGRRLRATPAGRAAALIALTGWGEDEDRRRTHEAGFDRHLVKPLDPGALEQLLVEIARGEVTRDASGSAP
ncbi:MAG TPA: PAS domain S-box protein, partial [Salinisphaeraceae bacterium]|nr:PAS domain S-box protein [Salinisphaeraceae bacterium]